MSALAYDVATALWQGARPYQEDTLLADFHGGVSRGFAVLADGMGGHAAGDLASRLVVIDAASHLKFLMHDGEGLEKTLKAELTSAIETANGVLRDRAEGDRRLHGMGSTFLATVLFEDRLYWASVGDSPLYLWREGELRQLNEDHSMAPVIDQMARSGEITAAEAAAHPDRNALTSVLMGGKLKAMDVPETAIVLDPGDVLVQASDGLQYLDEEQISDVLARGGSSRELADGLMSALRDLDDPSQDNTAVLVLQLAAEQGGVVAGQQGAVASALAAAGVQASAHERAAGPRPGGEGAAGAAQGETLAPRAATPTDVARPAGARRWILPAGLLSSAAVIAGLVFGLPGVLTGPGPDARTGTTFETAALTPSQTPEVPEVPLADPPAPEALALPAPQASARPVPVDVLPAPVPASPGAAATVAAVPQSPISRSIVAPLAPETDAPTAADAHEIIGESAGTSGIALAPAAPVPALVPIAPASPQVAAAPAQIGDKFAQPPEAGAAQATIQFEAGSGDASTQPGVIPVQPLTVQPVIVQPLTVQPLPAQPLAIQPAQSDGLTAPDTVAGPGEVQPQDPIQAPETQRSPGGQDRKPQQERGIPDGR